MTTASAAVYPLLRPVKKSSSSVHVRTWQNALLYAINGGIDEKTKVQVGPAYRPITAEYLDYDEVMKHYDTMMDWLAKLYVDTSEHDSLHA